MKNNTFVFLVDYAFSANFFFRLAKARISERCVVITPLLSVYLRALSCSYVDKVVYIHRYSKRKSIEDLSFERCREVRLGILSVASARAYCEGFVYALENTLIDKEGVICLWNGDSLLGAVARYLKARGRVKTLFFEYANLPCKVFCDPDGVNQASGLYRNPSILNEFELDLSEFSRWKQEYIKLKLNGALPPQVALSRQISVSNIIDFLASFIVSYRLYMKQSFVNKFRSFLTPSPRSNRAMTSASLPANFIFFPLQVSSDTQVMLNSNFTNLSAIEYVLNSTSRSLVLKPHPVEKDLKYLHEFVEKNPEKERIAISFDNTYELILKSESVCVINSTVGFEALLMNKKVTFLGRSFFAGMNDEQAGRYVMGYLIDVDFFDADGCVASQALEKIQNRTLVS